MAAYVASNYGYREETGSGLSKSKLILKEELRKNWYVYGTADGTVFRPYPVFDGQGNCCPPLGNPDSPAEWEILPDSFAALRVAMYAGMDKNLEFLDMCSDIQNYNADNVEHMQTPYDCLVKALRAMSPTKNDPSRTRDGHPQPRELRNLTAKFGVPGITDCVMCRGAILVNGGKPVTARAAIEGILYTAVICIKQQGAIARLYELFRTKKEDTEPLTPMNTAVSSMFSLNGTGFKVQNQGQQGKNDYSLVKHFDQNYAPKFCNAFKCNGKDGEYWSALRKLFGPYQSIKDIFNEMTVEEMVNVLKENYPISWLWYAWKDTPYASLVSAMEQQQALKDPEMASRFGLGEGSNVQMAKEAMKASEVTYNVKGQEEGGIKQPTWNGPGYGGYNQSKDEDQIPYQSSAPQNNVPTTPAGYPAPPSYAQSEEPQATEEEDPLEKIAKKYGNWQGNK